LWGRNLADDQVVPVHSRAAEALDAYLEASGLGATPEAPLFQSYLPGHGSSGRFVERHHSDRGS
jgi:site-specific recombinase XerC